MRVQSTVFLWRAIVLLVEISRKITGAGKTYLIGDLRDRAVCGCQQLGANLQPITDQIVNGRFLNITFEKRQAPTLTETTDFCNVIQCDFLLIMQLSVHPTSKLRATLLIRHGTMHTASHNWTNL